MQAPVVGVQGDEPKADQTDGGRDGQIVWSIAKTVADDHPEIDSEQRCTRLPGKRNRDAGCRQIETDAEVAPESATALSLARRLSAARGSDEEKTVNHTMLDETAGNAVLATVDNM